MLWNLLSPRLNMFMVNDKIWYSTICKLYLMKAKELINQDEIKTYFPELDHFFNFDCAQVIVYLLIKY